MKQRKKIISSIFIIAATMIMTTGCASDMVAYLRREDPFIAMEKYLEEKYDDDVTLVSKDIEESYRAFWNKTVYGGGFVSDKIPNQEIGVAAFVTKDKKGYVFCDEYQRAFHYDELNEIVMQEAETIFPQNCLIKVYNKGDYDAADIEIMSLEAYSTEYERYAVCIIVQNMLEEDAIKLSKELEMNIAEKNIRCSWSVGKIIDETKNIEEKVTINGDFNPWRGDTVHWLMEKDFDEEWRSMENDSYQH